METSVPSPHSPLPSAHNRRVCSAPGLAAPGLAAPHLLAQRHAKEPKILKKWHPYLTRNFPFLSTINVANFVTLKLNDNKLSALGTQVLSLIESQDLLVSSWGRLSHYLRCRLQKVEPPSTTQTTYLGYGTDRLVKSWIVGTLSEDVLVMPSVFKFAAEVWTALTNHFKRSSIAREFDLLAQLQHIRKGNNPLPTYLRNFKSICDQLHAIGKPVSNSTKVFRLLDGLDESYKPFKTTMFRPPIPLYTEVVPQLQTYELRIKRHSSPAPDVSMAFVSQRGHGSNRYQSDDIPRGLAALHVTDVHDDEWHPDTGANAHITDKPGNLTDLVPILDLIV
uniref:Retrotransposon gag domain-containing protein n=1 Tax=Ananas comosus var. bracteatus TaxID=296719 RepID=A0A6V7PRL7_ANACO|nr:unnamed protein product [Ananas comosus var. bracteatus]